MLLNEYAIRVYSLISYALKMDAAESLKMIQASSVPFMEKETQQRVIGDLQTQAEGLQSRAVCDDDSDSGITRLEQLQRK